MTNYSISQVQQGRKTIWILKDGNKVIARGNSKASVARVLAFVMGIKL